MLFVRMQLKQYTISLTKTTIDLENQYGNFKFHHSKRALRQNSRCPCQHSRAVGEKTFYLEKGTRVLLFSLVYILNGNHDPKKVQGLNLVLVGNFFMVGFIFNQDLLPFGFAFSGIALLNGVNMSVVQNFSGKVRNPLEREIVRSYPLLPTTA